MEPIELNSFPMLKKKKNKQVPVNSLEMVYGER